MVGDVMRLFDPFGVVGGVGCVCFPRISSGAITVSSRWDLREETAGADRINTPPACGPPPMLTGQAPLEKRGGVFGVNLGPEATHWRL